MIFPRLKWAPPRDDDASSGKDDPSVGMFEYRPLVSPAADPFFKEPDPATVRPGAPAPKPAVAVPVSSTPPAQGTGQAAPPATPAPITPSEPEPTPLSEVVMPPSVQEVYSRQSRDHYSAEVPHGREHSSGDAAVALSGEQYMRQRFAPPPAASPNPLDEIYGKQRRTAAPVDAPSGFEPAATSHRVGAAGTGLTIREGEPPKEEPHEVLSPWIWTLVKVVLALFVVAILLMVRLNLTSVDGEVRTVPLAWWLVKQVVMSSEERLVQRVPPEERPMALTLHRARRAQAALSRYYSMNGGMPGDILQLSEQRFIESDKLLDGWDHLFVGEYLNTRIVIRSAGPNGVFKDSDDIVVDDQNAIVSP